MMTLQPQALWAVYLLTLDTMESFTIAHGAMDTVSWPAMPVDLHIDLAVTQ